MIQQLLKRVLDIVFSLTGLVLLSPLYILVAVAIVSESNGGVFFRQLRVGRGNRDFFLYKFRSMYVASEQQGQLTIGMNDARITRCGTFLRKYKLDELPQLLNVLKGDMSLVGPRPEVRRYVALYTPEQLRVLSVRPGITDYASLTYFKENELLGQSENPEQTYIQEIMPAKLSMNLAYIDQQGLFTDISIIFKTVLRLII